MNAYMPPTEAHSSARPATMRFSAWAVPSRPRLASVPRPAFPRKTIWRGRVPAKINLARLFPAKVNLASLAKRENLGNPLAKRILRGIAPRQTRFAGNHPSPNAFSQEASPEGPGRLPRRLGRAGDNNRKVAERGLAPIGQGRALERPGRGGQPNHHVCRKAQVA